MQRIAAAVIILSGIVSFVRVGFALDAVNVAHAVAGFQAPFAALMGAVVVECLAVVIVLAGACNFLASLE